MTTRYTIKRAFRDNYCLLRLTELQIYIISLTGSDVARANAFEDEVDAEPAISYLGINLANLQEIMLAVLVESGCEPRFYPVDVMLTGVDVGDAQDGVLQRFQVEGHQTAIGALMCAAVGRCCPRGFRVRLN